MTLWDSVGAFHPSDDSADHLDQPNAFGLVDWQIRNSGEQHVLLNQVVATAIST